MRGKERYKRTDCGIHSISLAYGCRVREKGVEQSLDRCEALSNKLMTFLRDTRTKESKCELAAHIIVNKAITTKVDMFVAQLQYRQTEEEERDPGPSSVEADHLREDQARNSIS